VRFPHRNDRITIAGKDARRMNTRNADGGSRFSLKQNGKPGILRSTMNCSIRSRFCRFTRAAAVPLLALGFIGLAAGNAAAVSGEITADTLWEGTVEVTGEVTVPEGTVLVIQPGTTVRFAVGTDAAGQRISRLTVHGILVAQGTAEKPILFTSAAATPQPADWGGISLERSTAQPSRISHASIRYAVTGIGAMMSNLVAEDLEIRDCERGITAQRELRGHLSRGSIVGNTVGVYYEQSSGFSIADSIINDNAEAGVVCASSSSPTIRLSTIAGNGQMGVSCFQGSSPLIEGNTIRGHQRGIYAELQSRPRISRNTIRENDTGIFAEKLVFPTITGNVITENGTGIYCNMSAYPEIHGNNIFDNRRFAVVLGDNMSIVMEKKIPMRQMGRAFFGKPPESQELPPQSRRFDAFSGSDQGIVDARGNWWGTRATEEMAKLPAGGNSSVIEDFFDKPDTWEGQDKYPRDRVVFVPWESEALKDVGPPAKTISGIRGRVLADGKPVSGVRVHVYKDAAGGFQGEGVTYSAPSASDGGFSVDPGAGPWYLVAKGPTPPFPGYATAKGDYLGAFSGNPVTLVPGSEVVVDIAVKKTE
jgi:parallel beta-helix repeat protein